MMNYFSLDLFGYIFLGEMIGTLLLVFLGNGINAVNLFKKSPGYNAGWLFVSIGWAVAAAIGILFSMTIESIGSNLAFQQTGIKVNFAYGLINPAFDITMFVSGIWASTVGWISAFILLLICLVAQFIGAILGQLILDFINWPKFKDADLLTIKKMHCTHNDRRDDWTRNMFTEFVAASILIAVGVIVCGFQTNNIGSDLWVPFVVGLTLGIIRASICSTAFAANPARDLGPRLIFLLIPLQKIGFDRKEQIKLFDFKYALLVPVLSPLLGGIFVGVWCWLVPDFMNNYKNSIYVKHPFLIFQNPIKHNVNKLHIQINKLLKTNV